jgi:protein-L-isoaspartate(D-aspartate) O-methyltransferase
MTKILDLQSHHRVLEIGTGSGYQTAFLAEFAAEVYTIERFEALSMAARAILESLGYDNVYYRVQDGSGGWPEHAPYDRIMVTAAAGKLPKALIDQLRPGGKMVIPIGPRAMQRLMLVERLKDGRVKTQAMMAVQFVEFVGQYGWELEH